MLLVEPDELLANATSRLLAAHDVLVTIASNAESAIDFVKQVRFDCVLIDVALWDGIDGVELARQIRRYHPRIRIVLSTALDARIVHAPRDIPVFQKPYRFDALVAAFCAPARV